MARLSTIFPFVHIPPMGEPVTDIDLADSLNPLLAGTYSLSTALAEAARLGVVTAEELHPGLVLLTGLIGLVDEVLGRWNSGEDAARPPEKEKKH
jgi:hypothetical protein